MRESIGGAWIMGIVVLFIVLFSSFLAVSINYTKAFRTKNKIISLIEQNEGLKMNDYSEGSTLQQISDYLSNTVYNITEDLSGRCEDMTYIATNNDIRGGYCIKRVESNNGVHYKVRTFIRIELPIVWTSFTIPINGETKTIYYDIGGNK